MPTPDVDAERLIDCLVRHEVAFVVVGGFAVELWNVPIQPTVDVDITPEQSKENLARLATALHELKAELRFADESVPIPGGFTADNIADMNVMNLITTAGPLDLTIIPAGTDGYPDLIRKPFPPFAPICAVWQAIDLHPVFTSSPHSRPTLGVSRMKGV
jgi:hypothetical protein